MQFYLLLWLIAATIAAPAIEPQTISNQPSTADRQKLAKQVPVDNPSYIFVTPVDTSELRQDEETIDRDVIIDAQNGAGEMMHTAEHMVFRPLFSYRKLQEKRNRQNGSKRPATNNNGNSVRRNSYVYYRPYGYYYPY